MLYSFFIAWTSLNLESFTKSQEQSCHRASWKASRCACLLTNITSFTYGKFPGTGFIRKVNHPDLQCEFLKQLRSNSPLLLPHSSRPGSLHGILRSESWYAKRRLQIRVQWKNRSQVSVWSSMILFLIWCWNWNLHHVERNIRTAQHSS